MLRPFSSIKLTQTAEEYAYRKIDGLSTINT